MEGFYCKCCNISMNAPATPLELIFFGSLWGESPKSHRIKNYPLDPSYGKIMMAYPGTIYCRVEYDVVGTELFKESFKFKTGVPTKRTKWTAGGLLTFVMLAIHTICAFSSVPPST